MKEIDYAAEVNTANEIVEKLFKGGNCIEFDPTGKKYGPYTAGMDPPHVKVFTKHNRDYNLRIRTCFDANPNRELVVCVCFNGSMFVLGDIAITKDNKVSLNAEYNAIVEKDNVKVGCQTIPWAKIEEVVSLHEKLYNPVKEKVAVERPSKILQGQVWKYAGVYFIVVHTDSRNHCLVSLRDGNRWLDATENINDIFGGYRESDFEYVGMAKNIIHID